MHYYQFNIGDYQSHTNHLTPEEDIIYRRLIDWCYLHEKHLPLDHTDIGVLIRMRTHSEGIANVLKWFFKKGKNGYYQKRIDTEIKKYKNKSEKAKQSANKRWNKENKGLEGDANAMRTHSERNAKQEPRTINQEPLNNTTPIRENVVSTSGVPIKEIVKKWNEFAAEHHLPQTVKTTSKISAQIRQRWKDDLPKLENWENYFDYISSSKFLMGKTNPGNGRSKPFRATLEWVTKEGNFAKIAAEEYH